MITFISEEGDVYACIWRMGASSLAVKGLLWMPSEWTDHCIQRIKSCQRGTGKSVLIEKDPDAGKDWGQKRRGQQMMGWLDQITKLPMLSSSGDSERMGSLICCSPWVHKESDTTWWLNNREETSLMVQCLRLYLPMQWVQVSSLVPFFEGGRIPLTVPTDGISEQYAYQHFDSWLTPPPPVLTHVNTTEDKS